MFFKYFYSWLVILLIFFVYKTDGSIIHLSKDSRLWNSFQIKQCRQKCYTEILHENFVIGNPSNFEKCHKVPNCFMCYDYCQALTKASMELGQSMCSDMFYCSKGCRIACLYHNIHTFNEIKYKISYT
ncbi:uncharacterized protein LOC124419121 [Lucilia cuprina]|uniref:uncharacterized protein LOC124419121 n=1 Tax=Lucilia cuprina TaxID=7375 RepID=UPI001F0510E3|nr:uncharacterized protein LOC124419121 [Lucilia cuprina]